MGWSSRPLPLLMQKPGLREWPTKKHGPRGSQAGRVCDSAAKRFSQYQRRFWDKWGREGQMGTDLFWGQMGTGQMGTDLFSEENKISPSPFGVPRKIK